MNSRYLKLVPLALIACLFVPGSLYADMFGCPGSEWPWKGQGPFVDVPASIAASPAGLVGAALAIAFVPADLVEAAVRGKPQDTAIPRFAHVGVCAGVYLGKGLAFTAGAPFWLLKQAFWDGPKRLFSPSETSPRTAAPSGVFGARDASVQPASSPGQK